jgi:hypothetical protein
MASKKKGQTDNRKPLASRSNQYEIVKSEVHRLLYIDSVRFAVSPYDIRMACGLVVGGKDNKIQIQEEIVIVLSPPHAKQVARLLTKQIDEYEENFMSLDLKLFDKDTVDEGAEEDNFLEVGEIAVEKDQ